MQVSAPERVVPPERAADPQPTKDIAATPLATRRQSATVFVQRGPVAPIVTAHAPAAATSSSLPAVPSTVASDVVGVEREALEVLQWTERLPALVTRAHALAASWRASEAGTTRPASVREQAESFLAEAERWLAEGEAAARRAAEATRQFVLPERRRRAEAAARIEGGDRDVARRISAAAYTALETAAVRAALLSERAAILARCRETLRVHRGLVASSVEACQPEQADAVVGDVVVSACRRVAADAGFDPPSPR